MQLDLHKTEIPQQVLDAFHLYQKDKSHKNLTDLLDLVRLQSPQVINAYKQFVNTYIRENNIRSRI